MYPRDLNTTCVVRHKEGRTPPQTKRQTIDAHRVLEAMVLGSTKQRCFTQKTKSSQDGTAGTKLITTLGVKNFEGEGARQCQPSQFHFRKYIFK